MSETSALTGPLRKMLEQAGCLVFRMPVGKIQKGKHWIQLCDEGTADLLVFPPCGGTVWVECKAPDGRTERSRQEKQREFRDRVVALGHRYIRAETVAEVMDTVK